MEEKPYEAAYDADRNLLLVSGSVDELAAPIFRTDLELHSDEFTKGLTVDLGDVDFFPSISVGVLAVARRSMKDHEAELTVVAAEGTIVARVLRVCGIPFVDGS